MGSFVFTALVLSLLTVSFVSAASSASDPFGKLADLANSAVGAVVKVLNPVLGILIGNSDGMGLSSADFLSKLMVLILVFAIAYFAVSKVSALKGTPWIMWVISIGVAILGVRTLSQDFVTSIVMSNSAFAVAAVAFIPFVLVFLIVKDFTSTARRAVWILFGVVFFALWAAQTATDTSTDWIYPLAGLLCILMFVFDGTVHKWFARASADKASASAAVDSINKLKRDLAKAHEDFSSRNGVYSNDAAGRDAYSADVKRLKEAIAEIGKNA